MSFASALEITEFPIPSKISRPQGITAGPDGNVWFTEEWPETRKVGRITPEGQITEFSLTWGAAAPNSIASGPDGNLWFTDGLGVGRVTPSGQMTQLPLPGGGGRQTFGIAAGPDGNLWFTEVYPSAIGRVTPKGEFTEFQLPEGAGRPRRVAAGPDGNMWFTLSEPSAIGRVTLEGQITVFPLTDAGSTPIGITGGPDKSLWFTERWGNKIGRIDVLGTVTEFPLLSSEGPEEITTGPDGNLWFTLAGSGGLGRIAPSGQITEYVIPTENSVPRDITTGPDGKLWFTEWLGEKIGRFAAPTDIPVSLLPENTKLPSISGTPEQGRTLTASSGSWTNSPTSFTYQWEDCDDKGESCVPIAKATTAKYTLTGTDVGHTIRVQVTASNEGGAGEPAVSTATAVVSANLTSAPTIDAESATKITSTDATLNADIKPHGLETVYKLQIDMTGNYKFDQNDSCVLHPPGILCAQVIIQGDPLPPGLVEPPESSLPASFESQHVSVDLASIGGILQPNATYHYRAIAANSKGFAYGPDQTFTTPSKETGAPIVESLSASGITANNATLNAKINPHGLDTKYAFYLAWPICPPPEPGKVTCQAIGTTEVLASGGAISASSGSTAVSVNLAKAGIVLSPGTKYEWWIEASNSAGTMSKSDSFSTSSMIVDASLTVTKTGTGSGTVSSSPAGIECGVVCSAKYIAGTQVSLFATPAPGSEFTGWSGGGCSGTSVCEVLMSEAKTVTAAFEPQIKMQKLKVEREGAGSGRVFSFPAGIDCGSNCGAGFEVGALVALKASPDKGSAFSTWKGCDAVSGRECKITLSTSRTVKARFVETRALTVEKAGAGRGSVKSSPAGIACTGACTATGANFVRGTKVTLSASPARGSTFSGWVGCESQPEGKCVVTMSSAKSVEAIFDPIVKKTLTVDKEGAGAGAVKSTPSAIDCGNACSTQSATFYPGTTVTLTPSAASGSAFVEWAGACSGVSACVVTMSEAETVRARFEPTGPPRATTTFGLTLAKASGTGAGRVASSPRGIDCGVDCTTTSAVFKAGIAVLLKALPAGGSTFAGWGGACSGAGACEVTMSEAKEVTAKFTAAPMRTLSLEKAGDGTGSVQSMPAGINCGMTCFSSTAIYPQTATVAMTAISGRGSGPVEWEGCDDDSVLGQCVMAPGGDANVVASFE